MKKYLRQLLICLMCIMPTCYAGGGIAHMFIAQEAIAKLPDPALRNLLLNNLDAYLVGSYYPDSGYIKGNHYGEDSHWDGFIYAYAAYLKEKYTAPEIQNPKLTAFLFGCAAHRVSDEIIHWDFYNATRKMEFHGSYEEAHSWGDTGIDLLLNVDKNLWFAQPLNWWVPVKDLTAIYHRMGKDEYNAKEILWGNFVIYFAGFGERLISAPAYPLLKWKMPWTAQHYYDWADGGMLMNEQKVAEYQMKLWKQLHATAPELEPINKPHTPPEKKLLFARKNVEQNAMLTISERALKDKAVTIMTTTNNDGSVEFHPPKINDMGKLQTLVNEFLATLIK